MIKQAKESVEQTRALYERLVNAERETNTLLRELVAKKPRHE
jgi:hypothetical protein